MSHDHNHHISNYNRAFIIGIILNIAFVIVEVVYGIFADSLALLADAGHNLSDVLSLILAWGAGLLALKPATKKKTFGFRKITILASLANALILLFALGGITWEAIGRFFQEQTVSGSTVITVAAIGVLINTITALLFISGHKHDLNIKGAFLHMAADAGISLGVVIAGIIIVFTGWMLIDPILSLVIVVVIFAGTWSLLRKSMGLAIDAVPEGININEIENYFRNLEEAVSFHDLHVWAMSTTETALSVHLVINNPTEKNFLRNVQNDLYNKYGIHHSTIQLEKEDGKTCLLNKNSCI